MRCTVRFPLVVLYFISFSLLVQAQSTLPLTPLQLERPPVLTQSAPYSGVSDTQCDASGTVYVHYVTRDGNSFAFYSGVTRIAPDGSAENIPIATLPGEGPAHVFEFAVSEDGSLHEILRVQDPDDPKAPAKIYYATFDADGSFHSMTPFDQEFLPSVLLPLPSGDFYASGVVLEEKDDTVQEKPMMGIFGPDAKLKRSLIRRHKVSKNPSSEGGESDSVDPYALVGIAVLGSDGNIYLLSDGEQTKIKVLSQAGRFQRELTLTNPFGVSIASAMLVSGSRILVAYEGEGDNPHDRRIYGLYDAQSGAVLRLYQPDFSGTLGCFDSGQALTVLMPQKNSGALEVGEAELR